MALMHIILSLQLWIDAAGKELKFKSLKGHARPEKETLLECCMRLIGTSPINRRKHLSFVYM